MNKVNDLKQFYEEQIKRDGDSMPEFKDLNAATLITIKNSISFAGWKLKRAFAKCSEAFKKMKKLNIIKK